MLQITCKVSISSRQVIYAIYLADGVQYVLALSPTCWGGVLKIYVYMSLKLSFHNLL
jgi:hypothetical protein